jgi:hypothetical protein
MISINVERFMLRAAAPPFCFIDAELVEIAGEPERRRQGRLGEELVITVVSVQIED